MHPINEVLGCAEAADVVDLSFLHTATPTATSRQFPIPTSTTKEEL